MEQVWNDTDRGKLKYLEKNLYSVVGNEWMSIELWLNDTDRETEVLGEKHFTAGVVG
jgi:hypothetical protein